MDILVIEDNADDAFLLTRQLMKANIDHFRVVGSGELAYDFLNDTDIVPLVIFLDLHLPGISGLELLEKFRQIPRLADVPVFVMTTSISPEALAEFHRLGISGYMSKPINLSTFMKQMTQLFPAATAK